VAGDLRMMPELEFGGIKEFMEFEETN